MLKVGGGGWGKVEGLVKYGTPSYFWKKSFKIFGHEGRGQNSRLDAEQARTHGVGVVGGMEGQIPPFPPILYFAIVIGDFY